VTEAPKPDHKVRLILYVGKGGVGKTTIAAATAARAAQLGYSTLVVSTDIAHSLGDVLAEELEDDPRLVADNLWAQEINVLQEAKRHWGRIQTQMAQLLEKEGLPAVQADELAVIPGMQEVAALVRISSQVRSGEYDCVVVDAAPTGETLRLLAMPDSLALYASKLIGWRAKLTRLAGPLFRNLLPNLDVVDVISQLSERLRELHGLLTDPETSSYRLVLTPDRTVLKEAQRAETYLNLFGYPIDGIVVNRVLPGAETSDPFLQELSQTQASVMEEIGMSFANLPIFRSKLHSREPLGVEALRLLATSVFGERDPSQVMHRGPTLRITREESGYVLTIPMPNVEVGRLSLVKRSDELYVEVGNFRRLIPLPATIAGLKPGAAHLREGSLEIPFADPVEPTPSLPGRAGS
jgi:arsenite-transporting ATPase